MKGLVVFRWLMPAALAALLSLPIQIASAHPSGGGRMGGHGMGGMGGHGMGGMGGRGMGGRPATGSHFFSRNGANHFDHGWDRGGRTIILTGSPIGMTASLIIGINSVTATVYMTASLTAKIVPSIMGIGSEIAILSVKASNVKSASSFSAIISSSGSISRPLASPGGDHGIRGGGTQTMPIILTMTIRRVLSHKRVPNRKWHSVLERSGDVCAIQACPAVLLSRPDRRRNRLRQRSGDPALSIGSWITRHRED